MTRTLLAIFFLLVLPGAAQEMMDVVIATSNAEVLATGHGEKLGVLPKGWAAEYAGEKGPYYQVFLFSGEYRYVLKSMTRRGKIKPKFPSETLAKAICQKMNDAEDRAQAEADRQIPIDQSLELNIRLARELEDNYKLKLFIAKGISPMHQGRIVVEAIKRGLL